LRQDYENKVMKHYTRVAQESGLSASCTMEDEYIRDGETRAILRLIELAAKGAAGSLRVLDVGCGNGYTLRTLAERIRDGSLAGSIELLGIEKNPELRQLAIKMNEAFPVAIAEGDILRAETLAVSQASIDVCLSQRVIINLMDLADQNSTGQSDGPCQTGRLSAVHRMLSRWTGQSQCGATGIQSRSKHPGRSQSLSVA
jgi:SAM-dependent methyltransferase